MAKLQIFLLKSVAVFQLVWECSFGFCVSSLSQIFRICSLVIKKWLKLFQVSPFFLLSQSCLIAFRQYSQASIPTLV